MQNKHATSSNQQTECSKQHATAELITKMDKHMRTTVNSKYVESDIKSLGYPTQPLER
jgi:hypothetical protein